MGMSREAFEAQLNDFNADKRNEALQGLLELVKAGAITLPEPTKAVNLHCHTFFSYNGYGYSPTGFAWKARCAGLAVAGIVDFDVLDAVEEFLSACRLVGLKGCAGLETRIFLPEFASCEINSPGELGVSYYMAEGLTSGHAQDDRLLITMRELARNRTLTILERVNPYLEPVTLDYVRDVLPRTPNGNATERHLCEAYEAKAAKVFPDANERATFWAENLGGHPETIREMLSDSPALQGFIRAKTMRRGGVGCVVPETSTFPTLGQVTGFALANGAIPTYTWLDGTSEAEQNPDHLLDVLMARGTAAVNIIPERNWNLSDRNAKQTKVANLNALIETARNRDLPIIVGTEMNAPGQRFVDAFDAPELAAHTEVFVEGAHIIYAHTALQRPNGMGYLSDWAKANFGSVRAKNGFYATLGEALSPQHGERLGRVAPSMGPADVLAALER